MSETTVEINREENFRAFWANAYAEYGPANTVQDILMSAEGKIVMTAAFSSSGGGIQTDVCALAIGVACDAGVKLEVCNGIKGSFKAADAEAVCNHAQALLTAAEVKAVDATSKLTELENTVSYLKSGGAWLNFMAMYANM